MTLLIRMTILSAKRPALSAIGSRRLCYNKDMVTTYVLHGGKASKSSELYFKKFTSLVNKDEVKILMCYWSRKKSDWDSLLTRDHKRITKVTSKKVISTVTPDPEDLLLQIDNHDVLFVAGGKAHLIEPLVPSLKGLREKLEGKVYIGSSMGAFIAAKNYVLSFDSQDDNKVHHGLNLLPISILCHWDIENRKVEKINSLKQEDQNTPIITLDEGAFTTFVY